jgi:SAM-dependent methyltransferase
MQETELKEQINARYSALAQDSCCLSCGGAFDHAHPRPNEVCVDFGSGRGVDVMRMAEAVGSGGFAYGVDTATGMLARARKDADALGVENVAFVESQLEKVALPDGCADLLLSNCTINHATDKAQVWSEVFRILKPGGRFVVSDIYSLEPVPDEYASDPAAVAECWAGAEPRHEVFATLERTGFVDIELLEESDPYPKGAIEVASFTVRGRKPGAPAQQKSGCGCKGACH